VIFLTYIKAILGSEYFEIAVEAETFSATYVN
jgi:hypothetical protein